MNTNLPSGSVFLPPFFSLGMQEKDPPEWNHFDKIPGLVNDGVSTATIIPNLL